MLGRHVSNPQEGDAPSQLQLTRDHNGVCRSLQRRGSLKIPAIHSFSQKSHLFFSKCPLLHDFKPRVLTALPSRSTTMDSVVLAWIGTPRYLKLCNIWYLIFGIFSTSCANMSDPATQGRGDDLVERDGTNYFEKICLRGNIDQCRDKAWQVTPFLIGRLLFFTSFFACFLTQTFLLFKLPPGLLKGFQERDSRDLTIR